MKTPTTKGVIPMKNRNRQRENRRLKDERIQKPWLNHEGYHDPTAYLAIRNIERSAQGDRAKGKMVTTAK